MQPQNNTLDAGNQSYSNINNGSYTDRGNNSRSLESPGQSPGLGKAKRHLPVKQKEKVFNEWGAVMVHQDELDAQRKKEDMNVAKLRQSDYKAELDRQRNEFQSKRMQSKIDD